MGTLYLVATPIGNLEDITIRAIKTLFSVDIIACEDTRRSGLLLHELKKRYAHLIDNYASNLSARSLEIHSAGRSKGNSHIRSNNIIPSLIRYDNEKENQAVPELIGSLEKNMSVALVSDAGTPLISDPGFRLVSECVKRGIKVVSIPGPSAALAALTSSGLPTNSFLFLGYPPEKKSHRIKLFQNLVSIHRYIDTTFVIYCAPHKLESTLSDLKEIRGDREVVIGRELTKIHEEVWRGKLSEAQIREFKGELVVLFSLGADTISPPR